MNHVPFGEKIFFIPNGPWRYGPGRAMRRLLAAAGHDFALAVRWDLPGLAYALD